ncbi:MAG: hypothetical protein PHQ76_05555 [Caldisericia bacterium]|nr:hypothetical protein [Caldisericia bacterium]
MLSCSSSTKPETGSLSGKIILVNDTGDPALDPIDYSGITVALYEIQPLDTTLVRINNEYPQIGIPISYKTEFDHRLYAARYSFQTNPEGNISFSNISTGHYHIVVLKEGWGYLYLYNVEIKKGENLLMKYIQGDNLILYPDRIMPAATSNPYLFFSGKHYVFNKNSVMLNDVTIEPGAILRIEPNCDLKFAGNVTIGNNSVSERFIITSNDKIYETNNTNQITLCDKVKFLTTNIININRGKVSFIQNGLQFNGEFNVENMIFTDTGASIVGTMAPCIISKSLFKNGTSIGQSLYGSVNITNNVFYNNSDKCMILYDSEGIVSNNYFINNKIGCQPFRGSYELSHNCFDKNEIGIAPCTSDPNIIYNRFYNDQFNLEFSAYLQQTGIITYCNPLIQYNNFYATHKIINIIGSNGLYLFVFGTPTGLNGPLNCPNNYWAAINPADLIYPNEYINFIYLPRSLLPIYNAGIQ